MDAFDALAATWPPAEIRRLGPWTLRRGAGGGSRVSAATLDGAFAAFEEAEAAMRAWDQTPLVMVRRGEEDLDEALAARGYETLDASILLAAPVDDLAPEALDERAIDCARPLACMTILWAAGGVGPARLAVMERVAGPKAWLLGRDGDRPAACAFVAAAGDAAMVHALWVAEPARRKGLATLMTLGSAAWARRNGASTLALAVTEANDAARQLYAGLGFAEAGRYRYRRAPD